MECAFLCVYLDIYTRWFTTVEGPLELRGDMFLDFFRMSVRVLCVYLRLLFLDRLVFRNQKWHTVSLRQGATFGRLFFQK